MKYYEVKVITGESYYIKRCGSIIRFLDDIRTTKFIIVTAILSSASESDMIINTKNIIYLMEIDNPYK